MFSPYPSERWEIIHHNIQNTRVHPASQLQIALSMFSDPDLDLLIRLSLPHALLVLILTGLSSAFLIPALIPALDSVIETGGPSAAQWI
jgi:hypothetical protein